MGCTGLAPFCCVGSAPTPVGQEAARTGTPHTLQVEGVGQGDAALGGLLNRSSSGSCPASCFAVQGKRTDQGYQFDNSKDFFAVKAAGVRATQLASEAAALKFEPIVKHRH